MFTQRQTAFKIKINKIRESPYFHEEGNPAYIDVSGVKISRVRVIGTVMQKFLNEKGGSIVLDDHSETIRARAFEEAEKKLGDINPGDLIEVFGKVRKYNEEVYIIIELITKITNPNWLLLRMEELDEKTPLTSKGNNILLIITQNKSPEGTPISEIMEKTGMKKEELIPELKKMLEEDLIFEPRKERFKIL